MGWADMIFAWTLHYVYIEHQTLLFKKKKQWKWCFQVPFKPTQPDRAVSASAGDIHSCRISVNSERAECSRDGKRSSFSSWIKVWKWRASWLSCKYSQPSTDQEKSLASISHSFPFLSFFLLLFFWHLIRNVFLNLTSKMKEKENRRESAG